MQILRRSAPQDDPPTGLSWWIGPTTAYLRMGLGWRRKIKIRAARASKRWRLHTSDADECDSDPDTRGQLDQRQQAIGGVQQAKLREAGRRRLARHEVERAT